MSGLQQQLDRRKHGMILGREEGGGGGGGGAGGRRIRPHVPCPIPLSYRHTFSPPRPLSCRAPAGRGSTHTRIRFSPGFATAARRLCRAGKLFSLHLSLRSRGFYIEIEERLMD